MNNNASHTGNNALINKKKRRFNVIDLLILLVIAVIIFVTVYAISPWSQLQKLWNENEVTLRYAVEIRGVDSKFINLIEEGDVAVNSVSKSSLGTVSSIESIEKSTALDYTVDESGVAHGVLTEYPDKYDITVHITATAKYEAGVGYTVNGCRVAVGEELYVRFPEFSCSGYCVAIDTNS